MNSGQIFVMSRGEREIDDRERLGWNKGKRCSRKGEGERKGVFDTGDHKRGRITDGHVGCKEMT